MKTKFLILMLFALFALAGCSPYPTDPRGQIQTGINLQNAGNSALQATQQERLEQAERGVCVQTNHIALKG